MRGAANHDNHPHERRYIRETLDASPAMSSPAAGGTCLGINSPSAVNRRSSVVPSKNSDEMGRKDGSSQN